jgi:enoyl-CoA hydratase
MSAYQFLLLERRDQVGLLTLNRPERYNAWDSPMRQEVIRGLHELNADPAARAIVVTGAGPSAFSAGQDLAETQAYVGGEPADGWMDDWEALYDAFRGTDKPLIAALNGIAAGSAFQAALLCDIRVGHPDVRMGQTEINDGLPSITGAWVMLDMLGRSRTVELILTGRLMDADECHRLGLIHHLVPRADVLPTAFRVATELAAKPAMAVRLNKQRLRELNDVAYREAMRAGHVYHREAFASGEPQQLMERFFAERAARKRSS